MEYKITTSHILAQCENREDYNGLLVHIRPPVQLNQTAVESYLVYRDFEPVDKKYTDGLNVKDVTVLGSTPEQTTIYASIDNYHRYADQIPDAVEQTTARVTRDIAQLLSFMGAQAIVE